MGQDNIFDDDDALDFIMFNEITKEERNMPAGHERKYMIDNIERIEATEERCGIFLEGASAIYDGPFLDGNMHAVVNAEVHAKSGTTVDEDFHIIGTAFDKEGKILTSAAENFEVAEFFALKPLKLHLSVKEKPAKIRIYTQKGQSMII